MADKTISSVICDDCQTELIEDSEYPHKFGLQLSVRDYGVNTSGMVYAIALQPPLDRDYHFCGINCLKNWTQRQ